MDADTKFQSSTPFMKNVVDVHEMDSPGRPGVGVVELPQNVRMSELGDTGSGFKGKVWH